MSCRLLVGTHKFVIGNRISYPLVWGSVADLDPKNAYHFAGSEIFSTDWFQYFIIQMPPRGYQLTGLVIS